jgi:GT2 family glycosyltransferase
MGGQTNNTLGIIIVTYMSADVIADCLESLSRSHHTAIRIVVCDNASPDHTRDVIRDWAATKAQQYQELTAGQIPAAHNAPASPPPTLPPDASLSGMFPPAVTGAPAPAPSAAPPPAPAATNTPVNNTPVNNASVSHAALTLLRCPVNTGYAAAANQGIRLLQQDAQVNLFWVLNPDCVVPPETASAFVAAAAKSAFSLMGGRIIYLGEEAIIQSDGGHVSHWTGRVKNLNQGLLTSEAPDLPDSARRFISGASMVASREFIKNAGLMHEDYFLYFEEVDWATRRGDLPLIWCPAAVVHHHGGTVIGTGAVNRAPTAFANYFNFRNRMRFIFRINPVAVPVAYAYSVLKILKILLTESVAQARGAWRGLHGLAPPAEVADRIAPDARKLAFAKSGEPK